MAEECNTPTSENTHVTAEGAAIDDGLERLLVLPPTGPDTLKCIVQNLQAACQRTRRREAGDSAQADPTNAPTPSASAADSPSTERESTLAASPQSVSGTEMVSTETWWGRRWIDKATPGEVAAMRELLL